MPAWSLRGIAKRLWDRPSIHDLILGALLIAPLILLLLPFLPYPGDHALVVKVWFRDEGARIAHRFSLPVTAGVCSEIRVAVSDRDPATGAYTKVKC
jgi:hypothetical protein